MWGDFSELKSIAVEYVYSKRERPQVENGVVKEIVPFAVVGKKKRMSGEAIKNLHWKSMEGAIADIVSCLTKEIHHNSWTK